MNSEHITENTESVEYTRVCKSSEVYEGRGKNIYFDDELQVALFRVKGQIYAVSNICLHQHAAVLCQGFVDELTVRCPLHGWVYSLVTGQTVGSTSRLDTYKVLEENGYVYLEKPEPKIPKWMNSL